MAQKPQIRARVAELMEKNAVVEQRATQRAIGHAAKHLAITKERTAEEFARIGFANMAEP